MTIFYVSTAGDDSNGGLADSSAWLTPSVSDSKISGSDTLQFKRGNTWTGGTTVDMIFSSAQNGSASGYTTLTAYDAGPKPILDADWDSLGNFDAIVEGKGSQYWLVEDLDFRHSGPQNSGTNSGSGLVRFDQDGGPCAFITVQDCDLDGAWREGVQIQDATESLLIQNVDVTDTGNATHSGFTGSLTVGFRTTNGGNNRITNCNSSLSGSEGVSIINSQGSGSADPIISDFNYLHMIESSVLYLNASRHSIQRHNLVTADNATANSKFQKTAWNGDKYGDTCMEISWESSAPGPSASTSCPQDNAFISNLVSRSLNAIRISEQDVRADMKRNRWENNTCIDCATMLSTGNIRTNNSAGAQIRNNAFFAIGSARYNSSGDSPETNWIVGNNFWSDGWAQPTNNWSASTDTAGSIGFQLARTSAFDELVGVITTADFQPNVSTSGGLELGHTDANGTVLGKQFGGLALSSNDKLVSIDSESLVFTGFSTAYVETGPPSDAQQGVIAAFSTNIQNNQAQRTSMIDKHYFRVTA